jgi:hypothetical protein
LKENLLVETIHVRAIVQADGSLRIDDLPFSPGEEVEVTVQSQLRLSLSSIQSPLKGTVRKYLDPTKPVAEDDWKALG